MSLALRIVSPTSDRIVTRKMSGLSFRKVAGGGCAGLSCSLLMPRSEFPDLGPDCKVYLYDHLGATLWEGYADNPGTSAGAAGESFDLSATGIMTLSSDMASPVLYRDTSYDHWAPAMSNTPSANVQTSVFPDGSGYIAAQPCVLLGFNPGQPLGSGSGLAAMNYVAVLASGQKVGAVHLAHDGGLATSDYAMQVNCGPGDQWYNATLSNVGHDLVGYYGADYSVGAGVSVRLAHTGAATNVSSTVDTLWLGWLMYGILGTLRDAAGVEQAPPRIDYLLASEIVADAAYRYLGVQLDPGRVSIDATSYQVDQLAYPSAVRMQDILDDLAVWEPDYTWEILPSGVDGRYGFRYRAWGTDPRYEVSVRDGYTRTGSDADLCNRVAVSWTDPTGMAQTTVVTSDVPALGARIRDADPVSLPDGQGSAANALRVGQSVLAAASTPPSSAKASVARRILDRSTGRMVDPEEIEAGWLVQIRETGDILRCTEVSYDHDALTATLTLGDPVYDRDQIIAASLRGRRLIPLNSGAVA